VEVGSTLGYSRFQGDGGRSGFSLKEEKRVGFPAGENSSIVVLPKQWETIRGSFPAHTGKRTSRRRVPDGALAKGGLHRSIVDARWHQWVTTCESKPASAGSCIVKIPVNGVVTAHPARNAGIVARIAGVNASGIITRR
jgi:hypothetical protein